MPTIDFPHFINLEPLDINPLMSKCTIKVLYVGENRKIRKIGLVTGGGSSFMHSVKEKIDVFLTGDLRYHESLDTLEEGGILIDIGHYESEQYIKLLLFEFFSKKIPTFAVSISKVDTNPIKYYS